MEGVVKNMSVILDKMAFHADEKMVKINQRMEEHIY